MDYDVPPDIAKNVILRPIWNAVHEGGNQIILVTGLPRKGKSELAVDWAYNLYRGTAGDFEHKFEIKKHCKWSKIGFQKVVRKYHTIGATPMWDEAGIAELGAHARQFWSESNISISTLFQIMGFHNQIAFITLPMKGMLDKHLRQLSHVNVEALKVSKRKNKCYAKVFWVEMSSRTSEAYGKYPRYIGDDGLRYRVKLVSVPRAPLEVRKEYEVYSKVFKEWLEDKLIKEEVVRTKGLKREVRESSVQRLRNIVEKIKKNPAPYRKKDGQYDASAISLLEDIPRASAYVVKRGVLMAEEKEKVRKE